MASENPDVFLNSVPDTPGIPDSERFYVFGRFAFDRRNRILLYNGEEVKLPRKAAAILSYLTEHRDCWVSRQELKEQFWKGLTTVEDGTVDKQISIVRRALCPEGSTAMETRYGEGWRFVATASFQGSPQPVIPTTDSIPIALSGAQQENKSPQRRWKVLLIGAVAATAMITVISASLWKVSKPAAIILHSAQLTMDGRPKYGPLVVGAHQIFFRERIGDVTDVVSIPVKGGEAVPLELSHEARPLAVRRDGSTLLLFSQDGGTGKLWSYSLRTRESRLLRAGVDDVAVSRDERQIAALTGTVLSVYGPDNAVVTRAELHGHADYLQWSPDGRALRFSLSDFIGATTGSKWELNPRGGRLRPLSQLARKQEHVGGGNWSASGKYFFYGAGVGFNSSLWVARGSLWTKPQRLTGEESGEWEWPTVDPNDESTLFALRRYARSELARFDAASKSWQAEWNAAPALELSYSTDCQWVAYTHFPDHSIWKARPDGSRRTRLTSAGIEAHQPHWSPDGDRIVFMGQNARDRWRVYQVPAGGGAPEELMPGDHEDQGVPTWSSDGREIIWGELLSKKPRSQMAIHEFEVRSQRLSEMPGTKGLWSPRWSPDGSYILAITTDRHSLRVRDAAAPPWREVAKMEIVDNATWSVDSHFVFFNGRDTSGHWSIYRVAAPDGKLERVVEYAPSDMARENWFGVSAEGVPLAFRDVPVAEIYRLKCQLQ